MKTIKSILKIAAISIALIFSLILAMECLFYFSYDKGNIFKDQTLFTNKSNKLAIKFIEDYNSGKIDSIIYKLEDYSFRAGHSKWMYKHTLFSEQTFGSYVDNSQSILVKDDYYFNTKGKKTAGQYELDCSEKDKNIFNKLKSIRNEYGLNKIERKGKVFIFNNGIAYFKGTEIEMYGIGLPINIRKKAISINNNWYKIPKPD